MSPSEQASAHGEPRTAPAAADTSIGDLIGEISSDLSQLVRSEIELAKAELKLESKKAGGAARTLAGAGVAAHLALLLFSLAAVFGLAHLMDISWATLIVAALWACGAAVLYVLGRQKLYRVRLKPEATVETLKEDAAWARNPTS